MASVRTLISTLRKFIRQTREASPVLLLLAAGSAGLLALTLLMQVLDPRQVLGVSTWLKPAKFAASVATAALTLAWMIRHLGPGRRGVRRAARVIAAMATLELVIITLQAARGVPSHFNHRTLLDSALFQLMGIGISIFWGAEVYLAYRAFRTDFPDAIKGWGIRLGLVTALLGGAQGFVMPTPSASQRASLHAHQPAPMLGSHSVGAPDGGPGLPVTHWNKNAGDLRVAHFLGLHGLQIIPLLAWVVAARGRRRGRAVGHSTRIVIVGAGAYVGLMLGTLVQALQGRSVTVGMGGGPLIAACLGGLVTAGFAVLAWRQKPQPPKAHVSVASPQAA
jgi:hypothetical protein